MMLPECVAGLVLAAAFGLDARLADRRLRSDSDTALVKSVGREIAYGTRNGLLHFARLDLAHHSGDAFGELGNTPSGLVCRLSEGKAGESPGEGCWTS